MIIELQKKSNGEIHLDQFGELTITNCDEDIAVTFKNLQNEKITEVRFWVFGLLQVVLKSGQQIETKFDPESLALKNYLAKAE